MMYIFVVLSFIVLCNGQQYEVLGDYNSRREDEHAPKGLQKRQLENDRPTIGVLSHEVDSSQHNYTSYIAASYVKSLEASGSRVVPILIGKDRGYYKQLMHKINGVLFPGGNASFRASERIGGYADAGQHIYEIALEMNDEGDYFPVFGTCLGFQYLIILASGTRNDQHQNIERCSSMSNQPLKFTSDFKTSKMFSDASQDIVNILAIRNVTINSHHFCIVNENLVSHNLTKDWKVTSVSYDDEGVEFIGSIENKRYPLYGVQFHPEKTSFEWKRDMYYTHTSEAIKANRYFIDFFVQECRKNSHSFNNVEEENHDLIYNYESVFTDLIGGYFYQTYFFR